MTLRKGDVVVCLVTSDSGYLREGELYEVVGLDDEGLVRVTDGTPPFSSWWPWRFEVVGDVRPEDAQ